MFWRLNGNDASLGWIHEFTADKESSTSADRGCGHVSGASGVQPHRSLNVPFHYASSNIRLLPSLHYWKKRYQSCRANMQITPPHAPHSPNQSAARHRQMTTLHYQNGPALQPRGSAQSIRPGTVQDPTYLNQPKDIFRSACTVHFGSFRRHTVLWRR